MEDVILDNKDNVRVMKNRNTLPKAPVNLKIQNFCEVKAKPIDWLWKDKIALGKITLFAGEPGVGKSQLLLYIASILSNGSKFHGESRPCEKAKTLLISGEDSTYDTIKPRLAALKADISQIDYVNGIESADAEGNKYYVTISLAEHLLDIEKEIVKNQYKLIIIDPISMYLGDLDENKNKEIRDIMGRLTALAERNNLAIILNSHFTKPSGKTTNTNAIYRVMGSIGFAGAARIIYGIVKDPEDVERRLFVPIKNNIAQDKIGLVYNIKSIDILLDGHNIETSVVNWLEEKIEQTANELLNVGSDKQDSPKVKEAKDFLMYELKDYAKPVAELRRLAESRKISAKSLYRAKEDLKIYESQVSAFNNAKRWSLSPESPDTVGTCAQTHKQ